MAKLAEPDPPFTDSNPAPATKQQKSQILAVAPRRIGNRADGQPPSSVALADGQACPVSRRGVPGRAWGQSPNTQSLLGH